MCLLTPDLSFLFKDVFLCRIVNLARDYSNKRQAFGRTIKDYPLHMKTLANMEVSTCITLKTKWLYESAL